jgi:hypothetical protein
MAEVTEIESAIRAAENTSTQQYESNFAKIQQQPGTPSVRGTAGGGQREMPCPNCTGEVLTKKAGRMFQSISAFLQRSFNIRIPTEVITFLSENIPVPKISIFKEPCKVCDGKGAIKDPTDDSAKYEAAAAIADSYKEEIEKEEAKLGACGNRYTIIQGSDLLEVGLGMNSAPSYRVDKEMGMRNKGLIDPGQIDAKKGGPQIPEGAKANHIQGLNPPASPGGHYVIKCSNRFSVIAGAQGIEFTTNGPITFNGGIMQFTGPEVTMGTQTGRLVLEGETVALNGKSVEVAPSDGHLFVKGTMSASGNMMVGGHTHCESASITKLETTGKNESSKVSSPSNIYGGPAFWGGPATEGITASLKELMAYVLTNTTNPEHAKNLPSSRFVTGIQDNLTNLLYNSRPLELVPTGICITPTGVGVVYNFPHIHAMPDQMHTHETRIPDIKCDADTAEQLRKEQAGVAGPAPLHKASTSVTNVFTGLWQTISTVFVPTGKSILERNFEK